MKKIFVIAGHGAGDPGAVGNGYQEAERVRALAKRLKDLGGDAVMLGDFNRNYYKDNGISNLSISKDYAIVELHMDAASSTSAKGGHVIIKSGFEPDRYDVALSEVIEEFFPGRSKLIVPRDNLANPKRAAAKGYNYRLLECGFITNKTDVNTFNNRMDDFAKAILDCFEIEHDSENVPAKPTTNGEFKVKVEIDNLNIRTGPGTNCSLTGKQTGVGVFTVVDVKSGPGSNSGWGKLKSGAGWISLDYAKKI